MESLLHHLKFIDITSWYYILYIMLVQRLSLSTHSNKIPGLTLFSGFYMFPLQV